MEKINLSDLIIEVTRKCNMKCQHCLRGNTQNLNQSKENIDSLFSKLGYVNSITFSGGEPSLTPEIIEYCILSAKKYNVSIGNFYCVTNGKKVTLDFLRAILSCFVYCEENEISALSLSLDQYHERVTAENLKLLKTLSFFDDSRHEINNEYIINQGRAITTGLGQKNITKEEIMIDLEDNRVEEGNIYLNCKGNLIAGCDFSYKNQDKQENIICQVNDLTIDKLIEFTNRDSI